MLKTITIAYPRPNDWSRVTSNNKHVHYYIYSFSLLFVGERVLIRPNNRLLLVSIEIKYIYIHLNLCFLDFFGVAPRSVACAAAVAPRSLGTARLDYAGILF